MKTKNIVFVHADDWSGMYINGVLVYENHSIDPETVLSMLDIKHEEKWADDEWLNETGRLPKLLDDVRFESK